MLKASIINPSTTLIELSHPPDFGIRLMMEGKSAKIVNGKGKGNSKSKHSDGWSAVHHRLAASTRRAPIIGPVHENETITVVSAHKK